MEIREVSRALIYGIIGGLAVTIIAVWAGARNPLTLLYTALAAFVVVAVAFEVLQRPWGRRQVSKFPYHITIVRKNLPPTTPPREVERGFLDYEMGAMTGIEAMTRVVAKISAEMVRHTRDTNAKTARLKELVRAPVEQRLRGAKKSADAIEAHARRLERLEDDYRQAVDKMIANSLGYIRTAPAENDFNGFKETLASLGQSTKESTESTLSYRRTLNESRIVNVSRDVNRATEHAIEVVDKLARDSERIVKYATDAAALIAKRNKKSP